MRSRLVCLQVSVLHTALNESPVFVNSAMFLLLHSAGNNLKYPAVQISRCSPVIQPIKNIYDLI